MATHQKRSTTFFEGIGFLLLACGLCVYALVHHMQADIEWRQSPYLFPLLIALFLLPLSLSIMRQGLEESAHKDEEFQGKPTLVMILATTLYIASMGLLGFVASTFLFLLCIIRYLGEKRWAVSIGLSLVFPVVLYVLFAMLLHVMLP